MTVSTLSATFADFGDGALLLASALARFCAIALLLAGTLVPTCCLDGSHHRAGALDGWASICFARAS